MSKTILITLASILLIGLAGFGTYEYLDAQQKGKELSEKKAAIQKLNMALESEQKEISVLREANEVLETRIVSLQDSIGVCQQMVYRLRQLVKQKENEKAVIIAEMDSTRVQYFAVAQQIENLSDNVVDGEEQITNLQQQQESLRYTNDSLYRANTIKDKELESTQKDLLQAEMERIKAQTIENIVNRTIVDFDYVAIRRTPEGKDYPRVRKEKKVWNYTIFDFSLRNPDRRILMDEEFIVKIMDLDKGLALSHIESNPAFPDSHFDTKDLTFRFDGKKVNIVFHNTQDKVSKNYAMQLFYRVNGKEYPLKHGKKQFIQDKKVISLEL